MSLFGRFLCVTFSVAFCVNGQNLLAQATGGDVQAVLRQMDAASAKFKSTEADFKWDLYERVVRETTTQVGRIYFERVGTGTEMGAVIQPPQAKTIEYKDGLVRIFDPGANHVTQLRGNQAQLESFLTLGFGGSGKDLEKAWTVTAQGTEAISDGAQSVMTTKLDLVPKSDSVRANFSHILIWVDPTRGISLKQQAFTPSEDVRTATFTHIRYNQKVDVSKYAIKTDKKTTIDPPR